METLSLPLNSALALETFLYFQKSDCPALIETPTLPLHSAQHLLRLNLDH